RLFAGSYTGVRKGGTIAALPSFPRLCGAEGGRMLRNFGSLAIAVTLISAIAFAGPTYAKGKAHEAQKTHQRHNHSGRALLGAKIHTNGPHVIDKVGKNTVTAHVKGGKVAGVTVKHSDKGAVAVKKYKTKSTEKLGQAGG